MVDPACIDWEILLVNEVLIDHESLHYGGVIRGSLDEVLQTDPAISILQ